MFEVRDLDLAGRIGRIKTNHGIVETPAFLPVIHPSNQSIPPQEIRAMGFTTVMTNSYITFRRHGGDAIEKGIHSIIEFDGPIMTDSGGYQILEYGKVNTDPLEIARYQEAIGSDFSNVLDTPTGLGVSRRESEESVKKTLESCRITMEGLGHDRKSLWIGPVQGGKYLDLVTTSARYLSSMPFDMFALGSPTEVMESYDFTLLAQMIVTAKKALPLDKPLHLFGLGHPLPLAMAVALGCDTFDSASYVLYARAGRYITETGTRRIQDLEYLPCVCRVCSTISAKQLNEMEVDLRQNKIAIHNLYMLKREIEATKQALREGRLWEYLGVRAKAHPNLWAAFEELAKNSDSFEVFTPSFKFRGLMLSSYPDHLRPEIRRANDRLGTYLSSRPSRPLLILPEGRAGPFVYGKVYERASSVLPIPFMIGYISVPVGFVPGEISDVYPFSQIVNSPGLQGDPRIMDQFIKVLTVQLRSLAPSMTFLVRDEQLDDRVYDLVKTLLEPKFTISKDEHALESTLEQIKKTLGD